MPTSSSLVTNLPADFNTFGQGVDTSLQDLLGGTTGQVLSKTSNTNMDFTWVTPTDQTPLTTKGDLFTFTTVDARLGVGSDGQVLTASSAAATGLAWATASGGSNLFYAGKNKIINGDFRINQRAFTSNTTSGSFNFDRWFQDNDGGTVTCTPQTFTPGAAPVAGYEGTTFLRQVTASQSAVSHYAQIRQKIESVRSFAGQTVTLSFWAKAASGTPKIAPMLAQSFGTGGSPSATVNTVGSSVTLSTSFARYSVTISVPSISGKTLGTAGNDSLNLTLWTSAGSDYNSLTNSLGLQNNTFDIWGVQIEAGSTATDFVTASGNSLQGELAMCQRYYWQTPNPTTYARYGGFSPANSTTQILIALENPVPLRTVASSISYSQIATFDNTNIGPTVSSIVINGDSTNIVNALLVTTTGLTQFRPYQIMNAGSTSGYLGLSAEL